MNSLSIRARITLWFAAALIAVVSLTYVCILTVSNKVLQKTIKDNLIETVENNVDEIEYYNSMDEIAATNDVDHFIRYGEGFLEVDDDFLESVNEVYTALYDSKLFMLYGENPVAKQSSEVALKNMTLHTVKVKGVRYYIYDRELSAAGLQGLWLRGVVAETQGKEELTNITRLSLTVLPLIGLLAILGGSVIAKRALSPIQKISATVSAITQGNDLKKRIELKPGKDELHQLADSFNLMFARLEDSFEKEKRFTSDVSHGGHHGAVRVLFGERCRCGGVCGQHSEHSRPGQKNDLADQSDAGFGAPRNATGKLPEGEFESVGAAPLDL